MQLCLTTSACNETKYLTGVFSSPDNLARTFKKENRSQISYVLLLFQLRRNSEEFCRRKQELQSRSSYRKHSESESGLTGLRNTTVASKSLSHYSPPISRRNPYSSYTLPSSSVYPETPSRYRRFDAPSSLSSRYVIIKFAFNTEILKHIWFLVVTIR